MLRWPARQWTRTIQNRDDPSIFVEKRFGLGYTINFANPKAVGLMAGFLLRVALALIVAFAGI